MSIQRLCHLPNTGRLVRLVCECGKTLVGRIRTSVTTLALTAVLFGASLGTPSTVYANGSSLTRAQAVEIARQRSGDSKLLGVKKETNNRGDTVFAIKMIKNGRVKVYRINADQN